MDEQDGTLAQNLEIVNRGNVRVILDDPRKPEDRQPVTIRIIFKDKSDEQPEPSPPSPVRIISQEELAQMMEARNERDRWEDESMTFGESVTLLIAMGVLLYLIYALLWPERF